MFTDQTIDLIDHFRTYKAFARKKEWDDGYRKKEVTYETAIAQALLEKAVKKTANGSLILTKQARKFLDYPLGSEAQAVRRMRDQAYKESREGFYS